MGLSRRTALRLGYAAIIGLLVFSFEEAYRIQDSASERHIDVYRDYVRHDEAMATLRHNIFAVGGGVRNFLVKPGPETSHLLQSQLRDLKVESQHALNQLEDIRTSGPSMAALHQGIRDFWNTVEPIPVTMLHAGKAERDEFVEREILPRRNRLTALLREMSDAGQKALQNSEASFARTRQSAGRRLVLSLALCLILGTLVTRFSLVHARNLERATAGQYREVAQAKRDLEQLSERLVEVEEEGRRKLSRELHDEIGQSVAILHMELSNASALPDEALPAIRECLLRSRHLAHKTVQTVRNIASMLRPSLLDDLGLVPALQWLLEDFMRRSDISCQFSHQGIGDELPDSIKTCVYRIAQEALHNCEKHAAASTVSVLLYQSSWVLVVEIKDNGRGFAVAAGMPERHAGLGILGMRERAARLGGRFSVDSSPGHGTSVSVTIPVPRSGAEQDLSPAIAPTSIYVDTLTSR